MLSAIGQGVASVRRNWGLVVLVWAANLGLAALLAVPLAGELERGFQKTDAAEGMLYTFDFPGSSQWSDTQSGWTTSFAPDILGTGFAFKNVDLLLKGVLPAGLFLRKERERGAASPPLPLDPVILGLGLVYLLAQTFLAGGLLGVFRAPQGGWTVRGLLHGSGFYFGRFLRLLLLSLAGLYVVFRLNAPLARFADRRALECVSESGALGWSIGRHALLLLAILLLHMVSSYAKVITVVEERSSAILAFVSALGFSLRNLRRTAGHYLAFVLLGVLFLGIWSALDARWDTVGYRTQLVTFVLAQAFVLSRVGLRLSLLAGQVALYQKEQGRALEPRTGAGGPDRV